MPPGTAKGNTKEFLKMESGKLHGVQEGAKFSSQDKHDLEISRNYQCKERDPKKKQERDKNATNDRVVVRIRLVMNDTL